MEQKASKPVASWQAKVGCAVVGALAAMSFWVSEEGYVGRSAAPASLTSYLFTALAVCFALLFWAVFGKGGRKPAVSSVLVGLLFGAVNALGGLLFAYDSWAMLGQGKTLALTLLRCLGQAAPMVAGLEALHGALERGAFLGKPRGEADGSPCGNGLGRCRHQPAAPLEKNETAPGRFAYESKGPGLSLGQGEACHSCPPWHRHFCRHKTLTLMVILLLCWSPYLVAFWPGTVCWDLGEMAAQFFGLRELTTWHPVFTTWIFGGCVSLGRLFGSDNLGAALFMLLQTVALAYALASALGFLRRCGVSRAFHGAAACFFALTPLWGGYAQFISKDTLYTAALLLFFLSGAEVLLCREKNAKPPRGVLWRLGLWGLLACLFRSNGLYVVAPTALLLLAFGAKGRDRLPLTGALAVAVGGALLFSHGLLPALGVKDETASGLYSVCFQQSARTLRDHGDEVTPEKFAEIDRVLDGPKLAELYEPWISDPVKYTFKYYGQGAAIEKEALARYLTTWRGMLTQYPLTYAEAFFAGNIGYYTFTPKFEGASYNDQAGNRLVFETYDVGPGPEYLHTTQIEALSGVRTLLAMFARGWRHIPLLQLLYCCASYTWLLVGGGLSLARRKQWRRLVAFAPALLSLGVCMLSPVNDYFRYFLPIVAMTWPLLGVCAKHEKGSPAPRFSSPAQKGR